MTRIRTIKPEFWGDEKLARLDPLTRLVFVGLFSCADDYGRLVDNVKTLDGLLFPFTDDTCRTALDRLAELGRIVRYTAPSGQALIQIRHWNKHQRVDRPGKELLQPPPSERLGSPTDGAAAESSGDSRETLARISRGSAEADASVARDSRAPILDLGPSTEDLGSTKRNCVALASERAHSTASVAVSGELDSDGAARSMGTRTAMPTTTTLASHRGPAGAGKPAIERRLRPRTRLTGRNADGVTEALDTVLAEPFAGTALELGGVARCQIQSGIVFAYWAKRLGHPHALLDEKRERLLVQRLLENGNDLNELLFVVDGARLDDWTMGRDSRSTKRYDGIETVFRDRAQVEKYATLANYRPGMTHALTERYLALVTQPAEAANA